MAFFFGFREDHTVLMPHPEPAGRKHMNITRRLKSFTALALSLCMGLQFYPVLGEETTEPVTTDLSTSTSVDWTLNTYTARNDGTAFSLGLTFVEGTVLHAGDTMSLALPEGYSFSDITEALPLYAVRNGVPGELLGSYTISGNVLSLVFNEVSDLTGVTAEITVTGTETQPVTEGYYKEHAWTLEQDEDGTVNTVTFTVPSSDIMNWTWVSEDGTWTTTVDAIQQTTDGTTKLVLSNVITNTASYTFTLPEGIKAEDANSELSYAPMNPDGTQSQSISIGTYNVTENTLTANVTTIPTEAVTVSLPFTWNTEPLPTATPEVVDEELVEAITEENEKLNETPAPTETPVVTDTPEATDTPTPTETPVTTPTPEPTDTPEVATNEINMMANGVETLAGNTVVINGEEWTYDLATGLQSNGATTNAKDIFWIDNSNGEGTRNDISADNYNKFIELFRTSNINLSATTSVIDQNGNPVKIDNSMLESIFGISGDLSEYVQLEDLGGTGHLRLSFANLPSSLTLHRSEEVPVLDENGNVVIDDNGNEITEIREETLVVQITDWKFERSKEINVDNYSFVDAVYKTDGYYDQNNRERPGAASLGEGWYFVQQTVYQADIVLRRGNNTLASSDAVDSLIESIKEAYSFYYDTGLPEGQPGALSGSLGLGDAALQAIPEGFGEPDAIPTLDLTVSNLDKYNLDGSEIIYNIDQTGTETNKENVINAGNFPEVFDDPDSKYYGDYLAEEINNDPVSNHGTDITKCYSGGTIYLTLTGDTNYQATKIWEDQYAQENNLMRPDVEFELWRYTVTKDTTDLSTAYQHASPVQATVNRSTGDAVGDTYSLQTATDVLEGAVATEDNDYLIDFKPDFVEKEDLEKTVNYLPKYDPEGNSYVYFARETMSGENANRYRVEYGTLDLDGDSFVEKAENLPEGLSERNQNDTSIYNGGVVSNVLNDTTQATVRKTWIADAFQSELEDVDVVLTLQRSSDNGQTWDNVKKTDGTDLTYTMGESDVPFSAENLIQEHTESVPTYDNKGNELIYRWIETAINQNGQNIPINNGEFVLYQNGQDVTYNSYVQNLEREERVTSIINQIDDKTQYHVKKEWEGFPEGFEAPHISLVMYRSNSVNEREKLLVKNGDTVSEDTYFQLDGNADESPTELFVKNPDFDPYDPESEEYIHGGYVQETESWYAQFTDLDLYDVGGSPFDYIVLEGNTAGQDWSADYSMEVIDVDGEDVVLMTIVNRPVGGREIYVRKRWLDDGDEQHRGDVTMTAYAINFSDTVNEDNFTFNDLIILDDATLNRDNNWWDRIGIPAKPGTEANPEFYTDEEIIVLETRIADAKPGEAGAAADTILGEKMYTAEQLHKIYDDQHPQTENEDHAWVQYQTRFHEYEATFSMEVLEDVSFYTVTNRRLGNINLTVTKKWVDGATGTNVSEQRNAFIKALNDKGYDLVMQLVASDTQDFDVVAPEIGENSIHLVHEDVPIQEPINPNDLTQGYEQTTSVQVVDPENSISKYYFWNLPKYNENGKIVRYTVREMAQNRETKELVSLNKVIQDKQISCEYVFDMAQTSYVTSDSLQPDDQQMVATNRLSGTKRVFFWKEWNDAYRLQNKQRPDIYLDLYQSVKGTNTISGLYRQGSWTFYNDPDITFFDYGYLDKYDEQGREYIYYAKESLNLTNASQFDYQPVDYKYLKSLEDPSMSTDENINTVIETLEDTSSIGDEAGYATSLSDNNKTDSDGNQLLLRNGETGPYVLKEYGVFSNSIRADVEISGKKIWANVPTGFEDADLVDVTFYLFQYLPTDNIPDTNDSIVYGKDDQGKETITLNGKNPSAFITIHDWEEIKYQGNYAFELEYYNENLNSVNQGDGEITVTPATSAADNFHLQKYDSDGNLYTYVLRERGYFGGSDADEADKEGDGIGFVFTQPTINNFAITNSYIGTEGEISLRKILELNGYELDQNDKRSSVSFRLTREYKRKVIDESGNVTEEWIADTDFYQDKVISYGDLVDGSEDINFKNLPIYAPNGNLYRYTVTENPGINDLVDGGYQAYAKVGIVEQDAFKADGSYNVDNLLQKVVDDSGSVSYVYQYAYPKVKEEQGTVIEQIFDFIAGIPEAIGLVEPKAEEPDTSSVTFLNVYTREFAPLEFGKTWDDFGQSATRFTVPMTFDIYRSADAQPGQGNAISEYKVGQIVIDLNKESKGQNCIELTETGNDYGKFTLNDNLYSPVPGRDQTVNYTVGFTYEGNAAKPAIHMSLHDYQTYENGSVLINGKPAIPYVEQQGSEITWNLWHVKAGDKVELTVQVNETTAGNDPVVTVTYDNQTMTPAIVSDREETNSAMDAIRKVVITANDSTQTLGTCSDWIVTIEEFSVYAPNGMPWKYKLTEYDEYPYTATVKSILFTYAKEQDKFTAPNTNTKFKNSTTISVNANKTIRDKENVNKASSNKIGDGLWNYTGFKITLNFEVYAKFVEADAWDNRTEQGVLSEDSGLYKMLHDSNGPNESDWISLADEYGKTSGRDTYADALFTSIDAEQEEYKGFKTTITYEDNKAFRTLGTDSINRLPRVINIEDGTKIVYVRYVLVETGLEMRDPQNLVQVEGSTEKEATIVYTQEFTPHFVYTEMPENTNDEYSNLYNNNQKVYKPGDDVVTYYLSTTAKLLGESGWAESNYHFMEPLFNSQEDATFKSEKVKGFKVTNVNMLPIAWIDHANASNNNTYTNEQINTIDVTNLRVRKTWVDDNDNWYGTRYEEDDKWHVDYQLQVKVGTEGSNELWEVFDVGAYSQTITDPEGIRTEIEKYSPVTGEDEQLTNYVDYINLPASGIIRIKTAMGTNPETYSYKYVAIDSNTFKYRVCEISPDGTVIEPTGTATDIDGNTYSTTSTKYNEAYTVTYPNMVEENFEEGDGKVKIDTYVIINTLNDTEFYAAKEWNDFGYAKNSLSGTITFELKYLKEGTGQESENEWVSFEIHDQTGNSKTATVTLNGKKDEYKEGEEPLYYEYEAWKAKWTGVPEVMPGSQKDGNGKTQYRVVEVIEDNNAYGLDENKTELDGSGTADDPYVLTGTGTESNPYTILNEFTILDVSKTVTKPVGDEKEINSKITSQVFTFTITPAGDSIPDTAMYQIYKPDPEKPDSFIKEGELKQLKDKAGIDGKASFELTDGQFARIYGLKKDVKYTVEETAISDPDGSLDYKVTYDLTECKYSETEKTWNSQTTKNQNSVTLPANKPECNKNPHPQIAVTNERLGKVTITKTNLDGSEVLEGMTFKLEVQTGTDTYGNAIWNIAQMWDPSTTWDETTKKWVDHPEVTSDKKGIVIFKNLELDKHYKLTEVSAPGYHKYPFSIEFDLPYKPTDGDKPAEDISADYYYSIENADGTTSNFYPEIKMTIENDQAFIMPDTSGTGFFWPGMIGVAVSVLSAGGYAVTRKKKKREEENEEVN